MTNENISVQNDVETIEIATTDIDVKEEIVDTEVTTNVENEQKAQDDDYLLVVNDLKEYFPISKSLIKSNTVYLKAVDGVSLKLKAGHTIGIVGESGCGKTTLGRTILRLYEPTGGEVIFEGKHIEKLKGNALRKMRPNFQMIFQDPYASLNARMTVRDIIAEPLKAHHVCKSKQEVDEKVFAMLNRVGLTAEHAGRYAHEFSGGQRQRVGIARALVLNPALVICDEPISALDVSIQAQVVNLLRDYQQAEGTSYLFIAHDLSMVRYVSDDIGVMYLGQLVESSDSEEIYKNPLHPYTKGLLSCIPIADPKLARAHASAGVEGDLPSPVNPKPGCRFCGRCPYAKPICSEQTPAMKEAAPGHFVACHLY